MPTGRAGSRLRPVPGSQALPAPNAPDDLGDRIIALCKERLADFKCPKAVYLVDDFPRATLDKVAKNKLREMADSYVKS